jgi:hypothetical protein
MNAANWNILGLVLTLVGILILFRYGMPYRVRTGGAIHIIAEETDEAEIKKDWWYGFFG